MIPTYIHRDELRLVWDEVRAGLEVIRSKGHTEWIVEDIYCDCYEQRSMLWTFHDDVDRGFAILQPNGKSLHIWCAYGIMDDGKAEECLNQIKKIAQQGGCEKLTFMSYRKGWEKKARALGFTPTTWEYRIQENNNV
jgi:hypothetical protein